MFANGSHYIVAMLLLILLAASGCQKSNPLVTPANCKKAQGMKTLKEIETLLGAGRSGSKPENVDSRHCGGVVKWQEWHNSNADGKGHWLTLSVGLNDSEKVVIAALTSNYSYDQ